LRQDRPKLHSEAAVLGAVCFFSRGGLQADTACTAPCFPIEEPPMPQQSSFSSHFGRISNAFAMHFYCANCEAERLMMISAIEPGPRCGRDNVVYQCTDCGAEKTEIAMAYRAPVGSTRSRM
jgi:hypothetical protein